MSQSITLSRSFSNADSFLAAQRELYREYRRTHKLDAAAEAKYVANVKDAAACIDATHNSFWVFGKVAPTSESYVSFVVLRKVKNQIKRWIIAIKVNRVASVVVEESPEAFDAHWREGDETGIDEFFAAQEKTKAAIDEPMGICPVCHKLVSLEWHDHADEAGQLDETGE